MLDDQGPRTSWQKYGKRWWCRRHDEAHLTQRSRIYRIYTITALCDCAARTCNLKPMLAVAALIYHRTLLACIASTYWHTFAYIKTHLLAFHLSSLETCLNWLSCSGSVTELLVIFQSNYFSNCSIMLLEQDRGNTRRKYTGKKATEKRRSCNARQLQPPIWRQNA